MPQGHINKATRTSIKEVREEKVLLVTARAKGAVQLTTHLLLRNQFSVVFTTSSPCWKTWNTENVRALMMKMIRGIMPKLPRQWCYYKADFYSLHIVVVMVRDIIIVNYD